jgi:hypothetical protein
MSNTVIKATVETFVTGPTGQGTPVGVTIYGDYLYTANTTNMWRLNLKTKELNTSWATTTNGYITGSYAITNDDTYIYSISTNQTNAIRISDGALVYSWTYTQQSGAYGAYYYNGFIYVCDSSQKIFRINTANGAMGIFYTHGTAISPINLTYYNGFFYIGTGSNGIYKVSANSPADNSATLFTNASPIATSNQVFGLVVHNNWLYAVLENQNKLAQINIYDPTNFITTDYASSNSLLNMPCGIALYKKYLYIGQYGSPTILRFAPSTETVFPTLTNQYVVIGDSDTGYVKNVNSGGDIYKWDLPTNTQSRLITNYTNYSAVMYNGYSTDRLRFLSRNMLYVNGYLYVMIVNSDSNALNNYNLVKIDVVNPNNTPTVFVLETNYTLYTYQLLTFEYPYIVAYYKYYSLITNAYINRFKTFNINTNEISDITNTVKIGTDKFNWDYTYLGSAGSMALYKNYLYLATAYKRGICRIPLSDPSASTTFGSISDSIVNSMFVHYNYIYLVNDRSLYYSEIIKYNTDNVNDKVVLYSNNTDYNSTLVNDTYGNTVKSSDNYMYVYTTNTNAIHKLPLPSFTVPADFTFDASNTMVVSSGNVKIALIDPDNTADNSVYYWYSTNGNVFVNSNIQANNETASSPSFYISGLTNMVYTISVKGVNIAGNSNTISRGVDFYVNPLPFTSYIVNSNTSGNITVSITDGSNNPQNNVSYYYYLYNTSSSTNNSNIVASYASSGNTLVNGITAYNFNITNVSAGTYIVYAIAVNPKGNSFPVNQTVSVYTVPVSPAFDIANTLAVASGNVCISLVDVSNTYVNNVFYLYSLDGTTYSNTLVRANGASSSPYSFFISGLSAQAYTVYVKSTNRLGNSTPVVSTSIQSYTTPLTPTFDSANSLAVASRKVRISLVDVSNTAINNVFYLYSVDGGNTYSNTGVKANGPANSPYSFFINGLSEPSATVYVKSTNLVGNSSPVISTSVNVFVIHCFKEGSKILTDKGYIQIQHLRKGHLVKTVNNGYKAIHMVGKQTIYHPALNDRCKHQLYICSPAEYPEIFEPLVITGCHSILVDAFQNETQRQRVIDINGDTYVTDNKYRLPACADYRAKVYEPAGMYMVYHFALENKDYYMNYGVYANGLLVETCSKRYFAELSDMEVIV